MPAIMPNVIFAAQASQTKWGVPASVTLAQYGLESAWGAHMPLNSNNPFGIKAKDGEPTVVATTVDIVHQQPFRKYSSIAEAFDDHGRLLATVSLYAPAMKAWRAGDLDSGVRLMAQHYATAANYADLLLKIIASGKLRQYDMALGLPVQPAPASVAPAPTAPQPLPPAPPAAQPAAPSSNWISVLIAALVELFRRK